MTSGYLAVLFIFIDRMPFLESALDNADPQFALVIKSIFNLHHVDCRVANQDPASGTL